MRRTPITLHNQWQALYREWHEDNKATRELANYGFVRTFSAQYIHWLVLGFTLVLLIVVAVLDAFLFNDTNFAESLVGGAIALIATILGLQQWSAARNEISLDKFYERLEVLNKTLDACKLARDFAGPWFGESSLSGDDRYERTMYVYREIDNLEYSIAKYKIGFMSSPNALRCLRTFRARCRTSEEFCVLAMHCVSANLGYDAETKTVVTRSVEDARSYRMQQRLHRDVPVSQIPSLRALQR